MRLISQSTTLKESSKGLRFEVNFQNENLPAFVIRYQGKAYAYINRCAHQRAQLDWQDGDFFDSSKAHLVCSLHGALYEPDTGRCVAGPCRGQGLIPLKIEETDTNIYLVEDL